MSAQAQSGVEHSWPAIPAERTWGRLALFGVSVSTAIATWCFVIGGYVSYYLPAGMGTLAMVAGGLVGILMIFLAAIPVATKYGVDAIGSIKPQLGERGSYLTLILVYFTTIGWNTVLLIFLGRAAAEILIATGVFGEGARDALIVAFGLAGVAIVWFLLRKGPDTMRNVGPLIAVSVLILGVWIFYLLVKDVGWSKLIHAQPSAASDSKLWNYTTGFELLVVSALSWWPYTAGMVRNARSPRTAFWPAIIGLSLPLSIVSVIGLFSGLAFPDSGGDPTVFLVKLGGLGTGVIALLFIALANIGTAMVGVYVASIGLRQIPAVQRTMGWHATVAVALLPVAAAILFASGYVFDNIGTLLAFMGVLFAPICGMQAVDYFVFRRQRLDVAGLVHHGPSQPYHFWHGFNPVGFVALGVGFATYLYLLDPVNYTSRSPYQYVSASIPSFVASALVYWVLTRLVVIPAGRGGYAASRSGDRGLRAQDTVPASEPRPEPALARATERG